MMATVQRNLQKKREGGAVRRAVPAPSTPRNRGVAAEIDEAASAAIAAQAVIARAADDVEFLNRLLLHERVRAVVVRSLGEAVQGDQGLAACVNTAWTLRTVSAPTSKAADKPVAVVPTPTAAGHPLVLGMSPVGFGTPCAYDSAPGQESARKRRRENAVPATVTGFKRLAGTPATRGKSTGKRVYASTVDVHDHYGPNSTKPRLYQSSQDGTSRRSLMDKFDEQSGSRPLEPVMKLPASSQQVECESEVAGDFLPPLPVAVAAQVVGFLSFEETVKLTPVCRRVEDVLELPVAFDPIIMDKPICAKFMRHMRQTDPIGAMTPEQCPLPNGLFGVTRLTLDLMRPDKVALDEDDNFDIERTEGDANQPSSRLVLDPLEEMCRRLRKGFKNVKHLVVSNIEDHRLDYRFLHLRWSVFSSYSNVELHSVLAQTEPQPPRGSSTEDTAQAARTTYTLIGRRGEPAMPTLATRMAQAIRFNQNRLPDRSPLEPYANKDMEESEIRFLEEHTACFRSGMLFHVSHAPWRTFTVDAVRRRYKTQTAGSGNALPPASWVL